MRSLVPHFGTAMLGCSWNGEVARVCWSNSVRASSALCAILEGVDYRTRSVDCPRCTRTLHAIKHGELQARWCESCGGVWLDVVACKRLRRAFESGFLARLGRVTARAADVDLAPEIDCPVCHERLCRESLDELELDACREHGMWFDKWELSEVVHAEMALEPRSREAAGIESLLAELRSRS